MEEVALVGFPAGLIGGRLYLLATTWSEVPHHWWGPLAIWQGGLGMFVHAYGMAYLVAVLLGFRLNFFVASLLFVAGLTSFFRIQRPTRRAMRRGAMLLAAGWLLCGAAGCGHGESASAHPSADNTTRTQPRVLSVSYGRFRPTGASHAYLALKVRTRDPDGQVVGFGWEQLSPRGGAMSGGQVDGGCGLAARRNGAVGTWYLPMELKGGAYRFRFELSSSSCDLARVGQTARQVVRFRVT